MHGSQQLLCNPHARAETGKCLLKSLNSGWRNSGSRIRPICPLVGFSGPQIDVHGRCTFFFFFEATDFSNHSRLCWNFVGRRVFSPVRSQKRRIKKLCAYIPQRAYPPCGIMRPWFQGYIPQPRAILPLDRWPSHGPSVLLILSILYPQ